MQPSHGSFLYESPQLLKMLQYYLILFEQPNSCFSKPFIFYGSLLLNESNTKENICSSFFFLLSSAFCPYGDYKLFPDLITFFLLFWAITLFVSETIWPDFRFCIYSQETQSHPIHSHIIMKCKPIKDSDFTLLLNSYWLHSSPKLAFFYKALNKFSFSDKLMIAVKNQAWISLAIIKKW